MWPWCDYGGRRSPLKLAVFVALFIPALWVALAYFLGMLGARPLNEAIREIGLWTIRLVFLALAVTPLRQILDWPRLAVVRRMIGVAACAYVLVHLFLYTAQQSFDLAVVAREIALRIYLTIGFTALLGLAALAATSTDGMVRRLGGRKWQRLHRLVYAIGVLAVIHFMFQSKLGEWQPAIMAGLLLWLLGYRLLARLTGARRGLPLYWVAVLGLVAAAGTGFGEALYFHLKFHAPLMRVLDADFSLATGVRPAAVVLLMTMAVTLSAGLREAFARSRRRPARLPRPA